MGGDPVPWALDEEHIINTLIAELKALHKAIPRILASLEAAKAGAERTGSAPPAGPALSPPAPLVT